MMINNIKYAVSVIQKHFRRLVFVYFLILSLFIPRIGSAGLINYTIGESYSLSTYLSYCSQAHFQEKYNSEEASCWPCTVIKALSNALFMSADKLIEPITELAKIVLLIGAAIWISMFFLKSVSSMAMQDSAKNMDGIFVFVFKVAFIYVLINGGIAEIIGWIIKPLLSIGMDVTQALNLMTGPGA